MNAQPFAPHTGRLIEAVSRLECIKPFVLSIAVMKMEAMMRRSKFRDYYDIYSILKNGADINKLMPLALEHSGHKLKMKGLMAMLTNGELFRRDEQFLQLQPVYDVTSKDIEIYIKRLL